MLSSLILFEFINPSFEWSVADQFDVFPTDKLLCPIFASIELGRNAGRRL